MHQTLVADRSHRSACIPAERLSPFHISSHHFLVDILHQLLGVDFRKTQINDALDTESHTHDEGDGNERHKSRITLYKLCLKSLMKSHVLFLSHHRQRTHPSENQYCKTCNSCIFLHIPYYIYIKAERGGFEPPNRFCRLHAFQACLFSHSSTFPYSEERFSLPQHAAATISKCKIIAFPPKYHNFHCFFMFI